MVAADWQAMKTEYITTDISYRDLAKKHGVHYTNISRRGKAEGWVEARKQYRTKTLSKTLEKSSNREANRLARLMDIVPQGPHPRLGVPGPPITTCCP